MNILAPLDETLMCSEHSSSDGTDSTDVMYSDDEDSSMDTSLPAPAIPSSLQSHYERSGPPAWASPLPQPLHTPFQHTPPAPSSQWTPHSDFPTPHFSPSTISPSSSSDALPNPFPSPLPSPFAFPSTPLAPRTPARPFATPEVRPEKQVRMAVPTPDFSALKHDTLSARKLTRTASRNTIPETPKKANAGVSRLGEHYTPVKPTTPALHSPEHFAHSLTPKVKNDREAHNHLRNFDQIDKIGEGSFSNVYCARSKSDGKYYAIKILKRPLNTDTQRQRLVRELKYVKNMNHPHVLSYIFCWEQERIVHYQMEWCEGGSLSSFMTQWQKNQPGQLLSEEGLWRFLTDLALGLDHIHSQGLVHLDLKPGNLFLDKDNRLKIGDFGLARPEHATDQEDGDSRYLAPEVMDDKVTKAADIFSVGATMFELACLIEMPQSDDQWNALRSGQVSRLPQFACTPHSPMFKSLVDQMMHPQPDQRPTTQDLLAHPHIAAELQTRRRQQSEAYCELVFTPRKPPQQQPTPPFISSIRDVSGEDFLGTPIPKPGCISRKRPKRNLMDSFNKTNAQKNAR